MMSLLAKIKKKLLKQHNFQFRHPIAYVREMYPILPANRVPMAWRKKVAEKVSRDKKSKVLPDNPNKIDNFFTNTALCDGIGKLLSNSYIVKSPVDIKVVTFGDGSEFSWEVPNVGFSEGVGKAPVSCFNPEKFGNYVQLPDNTLKTVIKIDTGWFCQAPEDYLFLISPLHYHEELRFTACSGMLDPTVAPTLDIPIFWHNIDGEELIEAGTPLALITPIKRNNNLTISIAPTTEHDIEVLRQLSFATGASFNTPSSNAMKAVMKNLKAVGVPMR